MSTLERSILGNKLPPPMVPSMHGPRNSRCGTGGSRRRDFTPVAWKKYWDTNKAVEMENGDIFQVYQRGISGPLLLLLHGGGYSALTWSLFAESVSEMVECQVMAFDQRGHGDTKTANDADLSSDTLAKDVGRVMEAVYGFNHPPCILIGHSMGGAIAVQTSFQEILALAGLVVIDVVEGTAMDALSSMQSFLRGRPNTFNTLQNAIQWSLMSGQTRNIEAARVSMPGQVKSIESGTCGTAGVELAIKENLESTETSGGLSRTASCDDTIMEEEDQATSPTSPKDVAPESKTKYTWRINLGETEPFWAGWFKGLSTKFLSCQPDKMLLLAGIDRLDKDLTVGQMQGKFQMQVLPQCGHAVHEDTPDKVAEVLATFLIRHKLSEPKSNFHRSFPGC